MWVRNFPLGAVVEYSDAATRFIQRQGKVLYHSRCPFSGEPVLVVQVVGHSRRERVYFDQRPRRVNEE